MRRIRIEFLRERSWWAWGGGDREDYQGLTNLAAAAIIYTYTTYDCDFPRQHLLTNFLYNSQSQIAKHFSL